jgi:hypothetical protein
MNIVDIYNNLDDKNADLMVVLVNLYDLLNIRYSNERNIIEYVKKELRGYPLHLVKEECKEEPNIDFTINQIPPYRKLDITHFNFPNESEVISMSKVIERLEGKTIITHSLEDIRALVELDPIEENLFVQSKTYQWEKINVRGKENNTLALTEISKSKKYPKKINQEIVSFIEDGIRDTLKLKLKTRFPQIQEQIFDRRIETIDKRIKVLEERAKKSQYWWKNLLASKDGPNKCFWWNICISQKLIDNCVAVIKWVKKNWKQITTVITLTSGAISKGIWMPLIKQLWEIFINLF